MTKAAKIPNDAVPAIGLAKVVQMNAAHVVIEVKSIADPDLLYTQLILLSNDSNTSGPWPALCL